MIDIKTGNDELKYIRSRLKRSAEEVNEVLRISVNKTLHETRRMLKNEVNDVYAAKLSAMRHGSKIKKANRRDLDGSITYTGRSSRLYDFRVSPASPKLRGASAPDYRRAKVKKKSSLKPLSIDGRKAFVTKVSNHTGVFERTGEFVNGKGAGHGKREHIKELSSISVPQMVGNEKDVYNIVSPKIVDCLYRHMDKQIERMLRR